MLAFVLVRGQATDFDFSKPCWKVGIQLAGLLADPGDNASARKIACSHSCTSECCTILPYITKIQTSSSIWKNWKSCLTFGSDSHLEVSAEAALMCLAPLVPISWSLSSWEMQWSTSEFLKRREGSCWVRRCWGELAKILIAHVQFQFPEIVWRKGFLKKVDAQRLEKEETQEPLQRDLRGLLRNASWVLLLCWTYLEYLFAI